MVCVVGVRFKQAGKIYYFDPGELDLSAGDQVILETSRGIEFGEVVVSPKAILESELVSPLKKVLRKATEEDRRRARENKRNEAEAFEICLEKINRHSLEMNLVDVEYTFDGSKIIFYFTADGRVDFRELVKDLAGVFRTRIELRQIGVRDEAKMLGGIGPCGRILCCTTFLGDFEPVSIKMAKEQNLSLNPNKISGICGRLMCCLRFEADSYGGSRIEESREESVDFIYEDSHEDDHEPTDRPAEDITGTDEASKEEEWSPADRCSEGLISSEETASVDTRPHKEDKAGTNG